MKVKGPTFEVQEYTFNHVPKESIDKYKSKSKLVDSYKDADENVFDEKLKLCDKVRKFPDEDTSLVTVGD